MPTNSTFLGLKLYNTTTDGSALFQTFRTDLAGISTTSNMNLIDTFASNVSGSLIALNAKQGIIYVAATYISASYYEATVAGITAYASGQLIDLSLNITCEATVTLKINALATISVLKINSAGSAVNISTGDLKANKEYLFRYNGAVWIWIDANSIEQINAQGTWGNLLAIASGSVVGDSGIATISGSKIASANIPISDGLVISGGSILVNTGSGLKLSSGSIVTVLDSGLKFSSGSISPVLDSGLKITSGSISPVLDSGLKISSGSIAPSTGSGIKISSGSIVAQVSGSMIVINSSGCIAHQTSAITPGAYTNANVTLDTYGHATVVANGTIVPLLVSSLPENVGIILSNSPLSANGKYSGVTESGSSGSELAFGNLAYCASGSVWRLTNATAVATSKGKLGICVLSASSINAPTTMLLWGKVRADAVFPNLTGGGDVFVGIIPGSVQVTSPSGANYVMRMVGQGNSINELFLNSSSDYFEHV